MQAFSFFLFGRFFAANLAGSCQWTIRLRNASALTWSNLLLIMSRSEQVLVH